ncbi:MAG TPA: hypothetical protein VFQ38_09590 [Longimicrobiales bacterium]|nr:hypothetical protein [Longimicrobiales bacterium]
MSPTCPICGCALAEGDRVVSVLPAGSGAAPALREVSLAAAADGALAYLCARHADAVALLESLQVDRASIEREVRGHFYQELDLLAYAFEMEAAQQIEEGRDDDAARTQQTRLGIRLAARLVGGVPAPEVDRRLERWRDAYRTKFPD